MQQADLTDDLISFLRDYYADEIGELADGFPNDRKSLYIDYSDVEVYDHNIADDILDNPDRMQDHFEEALRLYDLPVPVDLADAHVRFYNLPEAHTRDPSEASRRDNLGTMLDIYGQVSKVSDIKPRLEEGAFECQRCGTIVRVPQSGEDQQQPHECTGCERSGPFLLDGEKSEWVDHQFARLQQPPEQTTDGQGQNVDVHLNDDLIDRVDAGDRVTMTGVVQLADPGQDQDRVFDTSISAKSVIREESDYEDINVDEHLEEIKKIANGEYGDPYELLVQSINPKHHGDENVKLAIGLQLFGGWEHIYPNGSRDRGDWHLLLLGDPGCGKSTFLEYVDDIAPRSTYASGKGASAAGMTAAAVSDDFGDTEWGLEAGALVLANNGVACVDEIDKMKSDAVSSMHDALEKQEVLVNKAGINTKLPAKSSLLAAGNPEEGRFNSYRPYGEQIDLEPALLSRFDIMFMVSDTSDSEKDRDVVDHMLGSRRAAGLHTLGEELSEEDEERVKPAIPKPILRAYIAHAKETCKPIIEEDSEAAAAIKDFFVGFRESTSDDDDSPVPLTYRAVEGLERLAESSARIRLSDTVDLQDAERAVELVTDSMKQVGFDPESGEFDADIIETGQSKSQRDRRQVIVDYLGGQSEGITIDELEEKLDIERSKLEHDVKELKKNGRIFGSDSNLQKS